MEELTFRLKQRLGMGAGVMSMAQCYQLHRRLEDCLGRLSDAQQMVCALNEEEKEYLDESKYVREQFVKDIAMALLGKKITI